MKIYATLCLAILTLFPRAAFSAEEAVVTEHKINVRGQPSLIGEVVTQLQKGEKVTILERIPVQNPKPGEPTNWTKIKLPANTPVWVYAPFVKDDVVTASRLNLRAGPGENYSVIGRMNKGTGVKIIRTQDQWAEIEAPEDAYAFVDSTLVESPGAAATSVAAKTAPPQPTPESVHQPQTPVTNQQASLPPTETKVGLTLPAETQQPAPTGTTTTSATPTEAAPGLVPPEITPQPEVKTEPEERTATVPVATIPPATTQQPVTVSSETTTTQAPSPTTNATPVEATQPSIDQSKVLPPVAEAPPAVESTEPLPKRVVRREGYVRPTKSIQAPTYFELVNAETKRTMNYLYEEKLEQQGITIKDFKGLKVIVTGEEGIDERWPKVPIMAVESIESAP